MNRAILPGLILVLSAAVLSAADRRPEPPPKLSIPEQEKLAARMNGVFDFTKSPRPYCALLILDQADNPWPSWWTGGNAAGKPVITAAVDWLEGRLAIEQTGAYSVQFVNAPHKPGMDDRIPGGVWKSKLKDHAFTVTITGIQDLKITAIRPGTLFVDCAMAEAGANPQLIVTSGTCAGEVAVAGAKAPFAGQIEMTFLSTMSIFATKVVFPFPGTELGLPGEQGRGITATLYTASSPSVARPEATDTRNPLDPTAE